MDIKDYKAGKWLKQYEYKSFSPSLINHEWYWSDPKINTLLEQSIQAIGELNAFSLIVPDVDHFIRMHIVKEASTSNRIEGTQTEIDEALRPKEFIAPERRDDWQEVQNYIAAMNTSIKQLEEQPLWSRLLCEAHGIILQGVRGKHKMPGEFRKSQNWIGGTGPSDAVFVPPYHDEIPDLMSDLENFWHDESIDVPHLIRIALTHYQFETIHPFLDGNGRIGRLLITLYLVSKGLLKYPTLYLSAYLEKHKGAYYDALTTVRASNDLSHWIRFFLNAVLETARSGIETFQKILDLQRELDQDILKLGKKVANATILLKHLYNSPCVTTNEVVDLLGIAHQTASALIKDFESPEINILEELTGYSRNRIFLFRRYLNLF